MGPQEINTNPLIRSNQEAALKEAVMQVAIDHFENAKAHNAEPGKVRRPYPESLRAVAAAKFMIEHPEEKVDPQAEYLRHFFAVAPRYIKAARRMLTGDCPEEIITELRYETKTVKEAEFHFNAYKSWTPTDIAGTHYLYVIAPEGEGIGGVAKPGITNDLRRRIADIDPAATHNLLFAAKFRTRRDAKDVEDRTLNAYRNNPSDRERIIDWDYQQILKWTIFGGGKWVPVAAGFDQSGRLIRT